MLKGGDLTMVNFIEDLGGVYFDEDGNARDVFHILAENGFNFARLRTHNNVGRDFYHNQVLDTIYQMGIKILKIY